MKSNHFLKILAASLGVTLSGAALAESVEGQIVATSGYDDNAVLRSNDTDESLCGGSAEVSKLRKYSGFTAKANGKWKLSKTGKRRCFEVSDWTLTKTTSGREPLIGVLSQKNGQYLVTKGDGSAVALSEPPAGLRALVGKKVLLDVKAMQGPNAKSGAQAVVTYAEF